MCAVFAAAAVRARAGCKGRESEEKPGTKKKAPPLVPGTTAPTSRAPLFGSVPYTDTWCHTLPAVLCHTAPQATGWRRADTGPALGLGSHPPSSPLLFSSFSSSFSSFFSSSRQHKGSAGEQLRRATKPPTHVFLLTCLTILVPPTLLLPILPLHPSFQIASTTFLNFKKWGSKAQTVFLPCLQLHSTHLNSLSSSSLTFALLPHFLNKTLGPDACVPDICHWELNFLFSHGFGRHSVLFNSSSTSLCLIFCCVMLYMYLLFFAPAGAFYASVVLASIIRGAAEANF